MTTLQEMARHHKRVDCALAKLGEELPKPVRVWAECRSRSVLYRYPCTERRGRGPRLTTPDDCPYVDDGCSGTDEMLRGATETLVIELAKNRA